MCTTCESLRLDRCPGTPPARSEDHDEQLAEEIDIQDWLREHRRARPQLVLDAVAELVLRTGLCPDGLGRTRQLDHRRN